jgi:cell pole-organizing protein PopZ
MAEILASIQRILSENEPEERAAKPAPEPERAPPVAMAPPPEPEPEMHPALAQHIEPPPPPPMEAESEDVLVLDRSMMVSDGTMPAEPAYKSSLLEAAVSRDSTPIPPVPHESAPMPHPFPLPDDEPALPLVQTALPPEPVMEAAPVPPMSYAAPPMPKRHADEGLVAPDTAAIAKSAIGNLVRTLAAERVVPVQRGGLTIEDLVREELRPLLKVWLDRHLPPLVEKLVQVEIERVVNRATS